MNLDENFEHSTWYAMSAIRNTSSLISVSMLIGNKHLGGRGGGGGWFYSTLESCIIGC